jgi:hypothetical protein
MAHPKARQWEARLCDRRQRWEPVLAVAAHQASVTVMNDKGRCHPQAALAETRPAPPSVSSATRGMLRPRHGECRFDIPSDENFFSPSKTSHFKLMIPLACVLNRAVWDEVNDGCSVRAASDGIWSRSQEVRLGQGRLGTAGEAGARPGKRCGLRRSKKSLPCFWYPAPSRIIFHMMVRIR